MPEDDRQFDFKIYSTISINLLLKSAESQKGAQIWGQIYDFVYDFGESRRSGKRLGRF